MIPPDSNYPSDESQKTSLEDPTPKAKLWVNEALEQRLERQQKSLTIYFGLIGSLLAIITGFGLFQGFKSYIDVKLGEAGLEALKQSAQKTTEQTIGFRDVAQKASAESADFAASLRRLGFAEGLNKQRMRIVSGSVPWDKLDWQSTATNELTARIDISAAGFTKTPKYFTSFSGEDGIWSTGGIACIYRETETGFTVFIHGLSDGSTTPVLNKKLVQTWHYQVNWIAIGE